MGELEELERRKRELELRRDIAKLERNERLANKASKVSGAATSASARATSKVASWGWFAVSICTGIGGFLLVGGLQDGKLAITAVGVVFLIPLYFKLTRRGQ